MQAVSDLDKNDADILGHGKEHLAQVLGLFILLAGILYTRQFCDALYNIRYRCAELTGDVFMGEACIFNHIMQQRRNDGILVQPNVYADVGRRNAVRNIRRAVASALAGVGHARHFIGRTDAAQIHVVRVFFDFFDKRLKQYVGVLYTVFVFLRVHCILPLPIENCEDCESALWPQDPLCR